jgi:hypothetical protein
MNKAYTSHVSNSRKGEGMFLYVKSPRAIFRLSQLLCWEMELSRDIWFMEMVLGYSASTWL